VTVSEGVSNRFDFTADLGATLGVQVSSSDGQPVLGVQVAFRVRTPAKGLSGFLAATNNEGKTMLRGLPPEGSLGLEIRGHPSGNSGRELSLSSLPTETRLVLE
jgi:hypothetical protein